MNALINALINIDQSNASFTSINTEAWLERTLGSEVHLSVAAKWVAGYNMPGYMPDNEPVEFDTREEACSYIADLLSDFAFDSDTEEQSDETTAIVEAYRDASHVFLRAERDCDCDDLSERAGQYVFWVTEGSSTDLDKDQWLMQAEDTIKAAIESEENGVEYACTRVDNTYNNENDFESNFQWQVFYPADSGDWVWSDNVYVAIEIHQGGDVRGNYGRIQLFKLDQLGDSGFLDWCLGWSVRHSDESEPDYAEQCSPGYHSNPFWSGLLPNIKGGERGLHWSEKRNAYVAWDTEGRAVEVSPYLYV